MTRRWLPALLATTLFLSPIGILYTPSAIAAKATTATQQSPSLMPLEQFVLPNGLTVYLSPNKTEPRFYAHIAVKAGGKHDPADATGIAHYLEHMLFKGTDEIGTADFAKEKPLLDQVTALYEQHFHEKDDAKRKELQKQINKLTIEASRYAIPGEMNSFYNRIGGTGLNAYTSTEQTVYVVGMPKNRLEQWAKVESERFKDPVFRLFQPELETVYEEKNRSLDNKERLIHETLGSLLYQKHPYGTQTVLGTVDHLKNPSLKKMYEFYNRYYVPNNMALILSGDFDPAEAKKVITKYFSGWKKKDVPAFKVPAEPPIQGVRRATVAYKGEEKVMLAFRTARYSDPDRAALRMIDMLMDNSETGLINLDLVKSQKVRGAGSYPDLENDYGAQILWGIPRPGQTLPEVEKLLLEQVEKLKKGQFSESNMKAIALNYQIDLKRQAQANEGRVNFLTEAFIRNQSPQEMMADTARLRQLTKQDIVRVAKKYFGPNFVSVWREDKAAEFPKITKPELEKVELNTDRQSPFVQAASSISTKSFQPSWVNPARDMTVRNYDLGVLQYHVKNPVNDLFNLTISYDFGSKHLKSFSQVMGQLNTAGTGKLSADDVAKKFYEMGVKAVFGGSDYSFSFNLTGPDENFEKAVALAEQILWNAKLDEKLFQDEVANWIQGRDDEQKDPNNVRNALRGYVRYGDRSVFLDRLSKDELKALTTRDYPMMRDQLGKQNFTIQYSGQLPIETVTKVLKKHHQPQQIKTPLLVGRKQPELRIETTHQVPVKIYFTHQLGAQAHLDVIVPGDQLRPEESILNDFYNEYMSGSMAAVMFQEVREARALAYSTYSNYAQGTRLGDQDQMLGYIGTQADKTVDALKLFIDLLKNPPRTQAHYERTLNALDNNYRSNVVQYSDIPGVVSYWADRGYDRDPRPEQLGKLSKIKLEDMFDYLNRKVASRPLTFTLVGDRTKIDLAAVRKLGEFEEVPIEVLFKN